MTARGASADNATAMTTPNEPFFTEEGGRYIPNDVCRGPWDHDSLHGRVIAGLMAFEAERTHGGDEWQPARMTVDLYRMPRFTPAHVTSNVVRSGNRIRIVDLEFWGGETSVARSTVVFLKKGPQPDGHVWSPPNWEVPRPEELAPNQPGRVNMWETRAVAGATFGTFGQKRAWVRETRDLVAGHPLTPFLRAAGSADFASPYANSGDHGLEWVNCDITLYLHRLPVDEWIGYEVAAHHSAEGVAVGECALYDVNGAIGRSTVCALAQKRRS